MEIPREKGSEPEKIIYTCEKQSYAFDFAWDTNDHTKCAIATSNDFLTNKIYIVNKPSEEDPLQDITNFETKLTPTALKFYPESFGAEKEILASAAQYVTLYNVPLTQPQDKKDIFQNVEVFDLPTPNKFSEYISTMDWHVNHKNIILAGSISGFTTLWDVEKRAVLSQVKTNERELTTVKFAGENFAGNNLIYTTASFDGTIKLVDCRQKDKIQPLLYTEYRRPIPKLTWENPSANLIAHSTLGKSDIHLFDVRKPNVEYSTLKGHEHDVLDVKFSLFYERTISSIDEKGNTFIWDVSKKDEKEEIKKTDKKTNKNNTEIEKEIKKPEKILEASYKPQLMYLNKPKPNSLYWNRIEKNMLGFVTGPTVELLRI